MSKSEEKFLRYTKTQVLIHWLFAGSFFVLAFSGLSLVIPALSTILPGDVSGILHRVAAVIFILSVFLYLILERDRFKQLIKESFVYDKDDINWVMKIIYYFIGKTKPMPPSGRLNGGEKLHHAVVIIATITISISGLFLWFGNGAISPTLFLVMIWVHNISMYAMLVMTVGHIYFTFVYGALPHMISGYTTESYIKDKHSKWYKELKKSGAKS